MDQQDYGSLSAKQSIVRAFLELLKTNNVTAISVKEIVSEAHVNRSTFYLHFQDKFDLMDELRSYITNKFLSFYDIHPDKEMNALPEKTTIDICYHILTFRNFYQHEFNNPNYLYDLSNALSKKLLRIYTVQGYANFASYGTVGYLSIWIKDQFQLSPTEAANELITIGKTNWSTYTNI